MGNTAGAGFPLSENTGYQELKQNISSSPSPAGSLGVANLGLSLHSLMLSPALDVCRVQDGCTDFGYLISALA